MSNVFWAALLKAAIGPIIVLALFAPGWYLGREIHRRMKAGKMKDALLKPMGAEGVAWLILAMLGSFVLLAWLYGAY